MIHFLPDTFDTATPYHDAVERLASIRVALNVAERCAGLEQSDVPAVPASWPTMSAARRRCFDSRSIEVAQGAAGLETNPDAVERLALTLRTDLAGIGKLFSL